MWAEVFISVWKIGTHIYTCDGDTAQRLIGLNQRQEAGETQMIMHGIPLINHNLFQLSFGEK